MFKNANVLIKSNIFLDYFRLRAFPPFRTSGRLYSRFIQTTATTNPPKKILEKRGKSGLIQVYVKYLVSQFYCQLYFAFALKFFYLGFSCVHDDALSIS